MWLECDMCFLKVNISSDDSNFKHFLCSPNEPAERGSEFGTGMNMTPDEGQVIISDIQCSFVIWRLVVFTHKYSNRHSKDRP